MALAGCLPFLGSVTVSFVGSVTVTFASSVSVTFVGVVNATPVVVVSVTLLSKRVVGGLPFQGLLPANPDGFTVRLEGGVLLVTQGGCFLCLSLCQNLGGLHWLFSHSESHCGAQILCWHGSDKCSGDGHKVSVFPTIATLHGGSVTWQGEFPWV